MMDLKKRRAELERDLQQAIQEWQGWGNRVQQLQGAIAENEAMQRGEEKPNVDGPGPTGDSKGNQGGPA